MDQQSKICTKCKKEKTLSNFNRNKLKYDGLRSECKSCRSKRYKENRSPEKLWSSKHHSEKLHLSSYRHLCDTGYSGSYKEMLEAYEQFYTKQTGKCAICHLKNPLQLDHCHKTGRLRGLLCAGCNWAIGCLDDNLLYAEAMVKYLS